MGASRLLLPSDAVDVVAAVRGGSDLAAEGSVLDDVCSPFKDLGWPLLVHMNSPSNTARFISF